MYPHEQFVWGFLGSVAFEILLLHRVFKAGKSLPKKLGHASYWIISLLVAMVAGALAVATQAPTPLLAMQIGVATPLLINRWSKESPPAGH
jgi:hypothetical protein